jgi:hypothetical protein
MPRAGDVENGIELRRLAEEVHGTIAFVRSVTAEARAAGSMQAVDSSTSRRPAGRLRGHGLCGRDEGLRGNDDFVPAHSEREERGGAPSYRCSFHGVLHAQVLREVALEILDGRAEDERRAR